MRASRSLKADELGAKVTLVQATLPSSMDTILGIEYGSRARAGRETPGRLGQSNLRPDKLSEINLWVGRARRIT